MVYISPHSLLLWPLVFFYQIEILLSVWNDMRNSNLGYQQVCYQKRSQCPQIGHDGIHRVKADEDLVPESNRLIVGGVQSSLQSFMDLLAYVMEP
ncbi:unnamed protein product [Lupinus luteus]|uniref:Uncharacterized protein n=1 Tax=Lupinus luteus TaxID=3873 RepID=A0AAV1W3S6_LUPLU